MGVRVSEVILGKFLVICFSFFSYMRVQAEEGSFMLHALPVEVIKSMALEEVLAAEDIEGFALFLNRRYGLEVRDGVFKIEALREYQEMALQNYNDSSRATPTCWGD